MQYSIRTIADGRVVEGSRDAFCNHSASGSSLEGLSPEPHFASPMFGEVLPARVGLFNQRNFLFAPSAFELFLASDCIVDVAESLVINQPMDLILFCETLN